MADTKVSALGTLASVDRTADLLYVVDASGPTSNKITINSLLGFTGGNPVSTSDTQTLTNKTLTTPTITVLDNVLTIQDNSDNTKQLQFQLSGITTGTTRTLTVPDATTTLVGTDATQTLTNKTLTSPTINTANISNPTLTVDTVSEFTGANGVTVDGLNIKDGKLNTNNSVVTANITDGATTPAKLTSGTGSSWAWQSWTPTWTNLTVGNGTVTARYIQIGKTVFYRVFLLWGNTTSISGSVEFSLPVTAASYPSNSSSFAVIGEARLEDNGTAAFFGIVDLFSSTTGRVLATNTASTYAGVTGLSSTVPMTWTTNDVLQAEGCYEAN